MLNYKKNINKLFVIFLSAHLTIWTLVPSLTNNNLPLDTIEALAWGSNLDWGFQKHPPMSALFLEFFYLVFGSQDWAYYLLSQIFIIFSFYIIFKLGCELLNSKILSFFSILLLEGIFFYNFTTPEFNVNVCQLPFWSLTVYYAWKIFDKKNIELKDYVLFGVFAAIGFLSKYLFIYLIASIYLLFFYLIFVKKERKFDFKYIISLEVFIVLLVPHLIWLYNNDFITITYGLARSGIENQSIINHIKFPFIFLLKQVGIIIPFLFLGFTLIKKFKFKLDFKDKKFIFLTTINLLPIILIFLTSVIMGAKIRTMWMTPFFLFFGTLLIYIFQNQINIDKIKNFLIGFLILFFLSPITYAYISILKTDKRTDYEGNRIALDIQKKWNDSFSEPINVVLGSEWIAGNLSYHLKSRPIWDGEVDKNKLESYNKFICMNNICIGNK